MQVAWPPTLEATTIRPVPRLESGFSGFTSFGQRNRDAREN